MNNNSNMYILHTCKNHFPSSERPGQLLVNSELQGTKFQLEVMKSGHWDQSQNPFAIWKSNSGGATKHLFFPSVLWRSSCHLISVDPQRNMEVKHWQKSGAQQCAALHILMVWKTPFPGIMSAWMWLGPYQFEQPCWVGSFKVMNNLLFWFYKMN